MLAKSALAQTQQLASVILPSISRFHATIQLKFSVS